MDGGPFSVPVIRRRFAWYSLLREVRTPVTPILPSFRLRRRSRLESIDAASTTVPWNSRADWQRGFVHSTLRAQRRLAWFFAAFWNLVSSPLLFLVPREVIDRENYLALLGLIFPLVGCGLLIWAVRLTLQLRRFGDSVLHLLETPSQPGSWLEGLVHIRRSIEPSGGFVLRLSCLRRTRCRGSSDRGHVRERVLWQEEKMVEPLRSAHQFDGVCVPVSFALQDDAKPTSLGDPDDRIVWLLEVSARVFGLDYATSFEVPVFAAAEADVLRRSDLGVPQHALGEWAKPYELAFDVHHGGAIDGAPVGMTVVIDSLRPGCREYFFPPGRNPGAATGLTFFTCLWWGAVALQVYLEAPILFPIVFGLFGLLLSFVAADLWLGTSRLQCDESGVRIKYRLLGLGTVRHIRADEIDDLTLDVGMQSGRELYYDLVVHWGGRRRTRAGGSIRSKREAEWLLNDVRERLTASLPKEGFSENPR